MTASNLEVHRHSSVHFEAHLSQQTQKPAVPLPRIFVAELHMRRSITSGWQLRHLRRLVARSPIAPFALRALRATSGSRSIVAVWRTGIARAVPTSCKLVNACTLTKASGSLTTTSSRACSVSPSLKSRSRNAARARAVGSPSRRARSKPALPYSLDTLSVASTLIVSEFRFINWISVGKSSGRFGPHPDNEIPITTPVT